LERVKAESKSLENRWDPLCRILKDSLKGMPKEMANFIKARHLIGSTYCLNALFYLRLRARHESVEGHPVMGRLVQCHKLLEELQPVQDILEQKFDAILEAERSETLDRLELAIETSKRAKPIVTFEQAVEARKVATAEKDEEEAEPIKRQVSAEMEKNKGLTQSKGKKRRNPRVANKEKYIKALKRRRASGVKEWQPPVNAYGGEMSGIRAGIRRSIKLKS